MGKWVLVEKGQLTAEELQQWDKLKSVQLCHDHRVYAAASEVLDEEIYTETYGDNPIIIQGAGAGAQVTARGVLGDLFRLVNV